LGDNSYGKLGIGNGDHYHYSPQQISFFKNPEEIISLCCGFDFCVCICKNGVFSWGRNFEGQLGIGNSWSQPSPQQITFFQNSEEIISLSCGELFCVCICKNGVFSWGNNLYGQLGIGTLYSCDSPRRIEFFKDPEEIIYLSCGNAFCVCVCNNGVFSWGNNHCGQLGIGNQINQSSPQQILFFKNPEEIISLSCGNGFSICLCKNGVFSWGFNIYGELGIGNRTKQFSPRQIKFFKNPEEIISLCLGNDFSICICKNGIFGWGKNFDKDVNIYPKQIFLGEEIKSFYDLSFPQSSIHFNRYYKKLLFILAREYLNPDEFLFGKYYLPMDLFRLLIKFI